MVSPAAVEAGTNERGDAVKIRAASGGSPGPHD
jgi:hypothetical protein